MAVDVVVVSKWYAGGLKVAGETALEGARHRVQKDER